MSPLIIQFKQYLIFEKGLSPKSVEAYLHDVSLLEDFLEHKPLETAKLENLQLFLRSMNEGEVVRGIHIHHQSGMTDISFSTIPENQVSFSDILFLNHFTHQNLIAGTTPEPYAEMVKNIIHESRTIKRVRTGAAGFVGASEWCAVLAHQRNAGGLR